MKFTNTKYLVREHVSLLKLTDRYDILDPESGKLIAYAKETIPVHIKALRLLVNKKFLPVTIDICDADTSAILFQMKRPPALLRSKVFLYNSDEKLLGYFRSRLITIGGRFDVFNPQDEIVAAIKGSWAGWTFTISDEKGNELGKVSKQWAGIGKELFTSADNYIISLDESLGGKTDLMPLLLMAGVAVDMVYKEQD